MQTVPPPTDTRPPTMIDRAQQLVLASIASRLPGRDRFRFATLFRLPLLQSLSLYSIPSASIDNASGRGLVDLLDFRLSHATLPIGSVDPLESLSWTLHTHTIAPSPPDPPLASSPSIQPRLLEWWIPDGYTGRAVRLASSNGHVHVLQWLKDSALPLELANAAAAISAAALNGHLPVLKWWRHRSGTDFDWTTDPLEKASRNGHTHVLDWWRFEAGLPTENPPAGTVPSAAANGHLHVLDWWVDRAALGPDAFRQASDAAARHGQVAVLAWLRARGLHIDLRFAAELACQAAHVHVLDWLLDTELSGEADREEHHHNDDRGDTFSVPWHTVDVEAAASQHGHVAVLQWWLRRLAATARPLVCSRRALHLAWRAGHADVLRFWEAQAAEGESFAGTALRRAAPWPLKDAAEGGHVGVFEWWWTTVRGRAGRGGGGGAEEEGEEEEEYVFPAEVVDTASANGHVALLQWLKDTGATLRYTGAGVADACVYGLVDVLQWWRDSGLPIKCGNGDGGDDGKGLDVVPLCAGNRAVLEWWRRSGVAVRWAASKEGAVDLDAVVRTSGGGGAVVDALQWWRDGEGEGDGMWRLRWTAEALDAVSRRLYSPRVEVLEWWLWSGLKMRYDDETPRAAEEPAARRWWSEVEARRGERR